MAAKKGKVGEEAELEFRVKQAEPLSDSLTQ